MRNKLIASAFMVGAALSIAAAPVTAEARTKRVLVCDQGHSKHTARTGTVVGAVGGGLLGNAIGGNTTGTLLGAGAGAVVGHEVGKGKAKKHCHYEYRRY